MQTTESTASQPANSADTCDRCRNTTAYSLECYALATTCRCCLECGGVASWRVADIGDEASPGEAYCKACVVDNESNTSESRPLPAVRLAKHVHSPAAVHGTAGGWRWTVESDCALGSLVTR